MATIYTRATKGSALTWTEGDANITNLNNDKIENVVDDTTPQLGGDLDVNGNKIVSTSNGNIAIEPNGTGIVTANKNIETTADIKAKELWSTNSTGDEGGQINLAQSATNSTLAGDTVTVDIWQNRFRIFEQGGDARGVYIDLTAAATGVGTNLLAGGSGVPTQVAFQTTPSSTDVYFAMTSATGAGDKSLYAPNAGSLKYNTGSGVISTVANISTEGNIILNYQGNLFLYDLDNSNRVTVSAPSDLTSNVTFRLPNSNGTNGQYLQSDGSGNLSWSTVSIGITDVVNDTTPQLGGNLDVNGQSIVSVSNGNISITPNGTGQTVIKNLEYQENVHDLGTTSGTIAPNAANGNIQTITLNGNLTINGFTSPVSGQTITLIITTNGTGRTLTSSMLFAGGSKTLSTTSTVDMLTMSYIGTTYYASLVKGYA